MATKKDIAQLLDGGEMVTVRWPGSGELEISIERHMIDDAISEWEKLGRAARRQNFSSVKREMKRVTRLMEQGSAHPQELSGLVADIALFIGHELVHSDGERWLVKGPTGDDILGQEYCSAKKAH